MNRPPNDGVLRGVDIVLSQHEVCCYALVVSLTAISLCETGQRSGRLRLFAAALDDLEAGQFEGALGRAKAAAAPEMAGARDGADDDYDALRLRLHHILARRPGRA